MNKKKIAVSLSFVRRSLSALVISQMELASRSWKEKGCLEAHPHPSTLKVQEVSAQMVYTENL